MYGVRWKQVTMLLSKLCNNKLTNDYMCYALWESIFKLLEAVCGLFRPLVFFELTPRERTQRYSPLDVSSDVFEFRKLWLSRREWRTHQQSDWNTWLEKLYGLPALSEMPANWDIFNVASKERCWEWRELPKRWRRWKRKTCPNEMNIIYLWTLLLQRSVNHLHTSWEADSLQSIYVLE